MRALPLLVLFGCAPPADGNIILNDGTNLDVFDGWLEFQGDLGLARLYLTNRLVDCWWPEDPNGKVEAHVIEMYLVDVGSESDNASVFKLDVAENVWQGIDLVPFTAEVAWTEGASTASGTVLFDGGGRGEAEFRLPVCGASTYYAY